MACSAISLSFRHTTNHEGRDLPSGPVASESPSSDLLNKIETVYCNLWPAYMEVEGDGVTHRVTLFLRMSETEVVEDSEVVGRSNFYEISYLADPPILGVPSEGWEPDQAEIKCDGNGATLDVVSPSGVEFELVWTPMDHLGHYHGECKPRPGGIEEYDSKSAQGWTNVSGAVAGLPASGQYNSFLWRIVEEKWQAASTLATSLRAQPRAFERRSGLLSVYSRNRSTTAFRLSAWLAAALELADAARCSVCS
jgi:hypothetical protein